MKENLKKFITEHKISFIISVLCIIIIIISLIFILYSSLKQDTGNNITQTIANEKFRQESLKKPPKHKYKLNNIKNEDGWKKYYNDNGELISCYGIDISYYQKEVDWELLKSEGISFVMLRLGYRGYESADLFIDKKFDEYIKGAESVGIDVGVYFFSQSLNVQEAIEEANFVVENLKGYNITYPVAYDWEPVEKSNARTPVEGYEKMTESCIAFCEIIEQAGYTPMLYANRTQAMEQYDISELEKYDIWLAEYAEMPLFPYNFTMWQYTSEGKVDGIEGRVDLNICFKDYSNSDIEQTTVFTSDLLQN